MNKKKFQLGIWPNVFVLPKAMEQKLVKQYQKTGDIKAKRQGGNSPPKVQGADKRNSDRNH